MSYVAIWLQACLHWRCAYFQTLSWNDTIFVVDWGILSKLCGWRGVKDLSSLVRYDDSSLAAIRHVQSIIPIVRPRPNIRSHSVLFFFAMQLSMIFDILLCLAEDVTESAFVEGERSGSYGRYIPVTMKSSEHPKRTLMRNARAMLWQRLRGVELKGG